MTGEQRLSGDQRRRVDGRSAAAGCYLCRSVESKARTEAAPLRRRSSVDEERRFSYRKGENESNERESERPRRASRAQSQAKVDKGSPSRMVRSEKGEEDGKSGKEKGEKEDG